MSIGASHDAQSSELLQGTLDVMIVKALYALGRLNRGRISGDIGNVLRRQGQR